MKLLTWLSLSVVLVGVIILFFVNLKYSVKSIPISEVGKHIGEWAKITGKVSYVSYRKGNLFLKVSQGNSSVYVFVYRDVAKLLPHMFLKDKTVSVQGVVQEYKGNLEVVLKKPSDLKVVE